MGTKGNYYGHVRSDVLELIPTDACSVLSVGCAEGQTESALASRGTHVVGIEPNAWAAEQARQNGLEVIQGDADSARAALEGRVFGCLVFADVLEHIADTERVLGSYLELLEPEGTIVISVPNFRNYSVFYHMFIKGETPYADAGIFDRTHVRITTRRLVERWLRDAGCAVDCVRHQMWRRRDRLLSSLMFGAAREFMAYQILVRAVKAAATPAPNRAPLVREEQLV